jgi:hypothetical protein
MVRRTKASPARLLQSLDRAMLRDDGDVYPGLNREAS